MLYFYGIALVRSLRCSWFKYCEIVYSMSNCMKGRAKFFQLARLKKQILFIKLPAAATAAASAALLRHAALLVAKASRADRRRMRDERVSTTDLSPLAALGATFDSSSGGGANNAVEDAFMSDADEGAGVGNY